MKLYGKGLGDSPLDFAEPMQVGGYYTRVLKIVYLLSLMLKLLMRAKSSNSRVVLVYIIVALMCLAHNSVACVLQTIVVFQVCAPRDRIGARRYRTITLNNQDARIYTS